MSGKPTHLTIRDGRIAFVKRSACSAPRDGNWITSSGISGAAPHLVPFLAKFILLRDSPPMQFHLGYIGRFWYRDTGQNENHIGAALTLLTLRSVEVLTAASFYAHFPSAGDDMISTELTSKCQIQLNIVKPCKVPVQGVARLSMLSLPTFEYLKWKMEQECSGDPCSFRLPRPSAPVHPVRPSGSYGPNRSYRPQLYGVQHRLSIRFLGISPNDLSDSLIIHTPN